MNPINNASKLQLTAIAIGLLSTSSLSIASTYNPMEHPQNNFSMLEQLNPNVDEPGKTKSILESLQQSELSSKRAQYLEILDLLKQNKLEEAGNKIADFLKKHPDEADYYNLQALLETLKKDLIAAQQNYDKALRLEPQNNLALLGSAKLALDEGQLEKAQNLANKAIANNDKTINAYLMLADIAYKQKNYAEVEKLLLTAKDKASYDINVEIEAIKGLGKFYGLQKQPEKILSLCDDLVRRYPNNTLALDMLAQAQLFNNQKALAEQSLQKIIGLDKQNIGSRLLLARLLSEYPDKAKETLTLLDETTKIAPDKPEAIILKTAYLIKHQQYPEALALANKIDLQFPKLILGKLLAGDTYLAQKQYEKANEHYQLAYKAQPNDKILLIIADMFIIQKKPADAIKLLNNALEKTPKDLAIHFKLATIYQQQNDSTLAETHYDAMLAEQSDNVLALNNLAILYAQKNDPRALDLAKRAYDKAPESPAILDTYGHMLLKQNQASESLKLLEKAAVLAPKQNDIQLHLAEAYASNNNTTKAIAILEPLVNSDVEFSEKKTAISLLESLIRQ
jgi:putative PEP-CTERM system TPR-repeat lipoprotein